MNLKDKCESLINVGEWSYFCVNELYPILFSHGFFTKKGPDFRDPEDMRTFQELFSLKRFIMMEQKHTDEVHIVKAGENPQSGDALVILEKNVAGIVKTADCVPIILLDPSSQMASIIHAGSRGTLKRITQKTLRIMKDLGSDLSKIFAIVGPSIGKCCYEIGEDLCLAIGKEFGDGNFISYLCGRAYFDLKNANVSMLLTEGVKNVYSFDYCTSCRNDIFYSYRKGDKVGRQISFVVVRDP